MMTQYPKDDSCTSTSPVSIIPDLPLPKAIETICEAFALDT